MKMKLKRCLGFLLTVCMLLTMLPPVALAESGSNSPSIQDPSVTYVTVYIKGQAYQLVPGETSLAS